MAEYLNRLMGRIEDGSAHIAVIGLGYVGLPIAIRFCDEGFKVTGFDLDESKVEAIKAGRSYIKHIPSERISALSKGGRPLLGATADMSRLKEADVAIICVPTPLTDKKEPDLSYVEETGRALAGFIRPGCLVSLESTTYPGTTDELLMPMFTARGLKPGHDIFLVFSPEREDPGRADFTLRTTPKVVGGITARCAKAGSALYSKIVDRVVPVSSTRAAEMSKLLENIYRGVNIALVNELKMLCDRMDIDIWEVIAAAATKPFGFQPFYPGPGLGGHCIPIDPFYLTWKAKEYDFSTRFIELAGEINTAMPYYVVSKVMEGLNDSSKSLKGSKVLVLGVAYKKNVDDMRESPSLELISMLKEKGAVVSYNDPYVPVATSHKKGFGRMRSVALTEKLLKAADCVLIVTDHSCYDYAWIVKNSALVVDTRNSTAGIRGGRVVKA